MRNAVLVALSVLLLAATPAPVAPRSDWKDVDAVFGRSGTLLPGGVYKVAFPRTDLEVVAGGVSIRPSLALGSWIAFRDMGAGNAMAMGDLVLLESEVNPVIDALQKNGIEQSALHNHLIGETPHVMYMHVSGHGNPAVLARAIRDALALTKTPLAAQPAAAPVPIDLPTADLDRIIGVAGKPAGGVYQFGVARREKIVENGMEVPPAMGMATSINFQPTGNGHAAVTGDFVLVASEVNPVIRALRSGGIAVTAVHSHMLDETPRLFFMHFWANDDARKLATTLRAALEAAHSK